MSAHSELLRIAAEHGQITAEAVVDAARDKASPLHDHFEWDDTSAARHYRLNQAGHLIRRYRLTIQKSPDQDVKVRAFSSIGDGAYIPTDRALRAPETRDVVIGQAMRELAALRRKYEHLIDFVEVLRRAIGDADEEAA